MHINTNKRPEVLKLAVPNRVGFFLCIRIGTKATKIPEHAEASTVLDLGVRIPPRE